jgi:tetratricopeptide (TPR) repeat protein
VPCLDADRFSAYFELRLTPAETAALFAHVDGCDRCARLMSETAAFRATADAAANGAGDVTSGASTSGASTSGADAAAGAPAHTGNFGRYRIERVLGMGGMGVVFAAHDPELDRRVAIKLLQPRARTPVATLRTRLMREAQAMARLSHPNVVGVHEVGTFGEQVFVVMELVEGMTLAGWLRQRDRPWREVLDAFLAAGAGLEAAHQAGIVHRDFKPDNVLVSAAPAGSTSLGRIRVTDFGLARRLEDTGEGPSLQSGGSPALDATVTQEGRLVGTPAYMAPEQMRSEGVDARSDVFSFSVALYEGLFGVRPYAGRTLREVQAAIEAERIARPARTNVPGWIERAVVRGLRTRPEARWATMSELLQALRADPSRRRRRLALVGVVVAACVALTLVVRHQLRQQSQLCRGAERSLGGIWDAPRKEALHKAALATGLPSAERAWTAVAQALDGYTRDWAAQHRSACEATRLRGEQSEAVLDERMQCLGDRLQAVRALGDVLLSADGAVLDHALDATLALPPVADCANLSSVRAHAGPGDPVLRAAVDREKARLADGNMLSSVGRHREALAVAEALAGADATRSFAPLEADVLALQGSELEKLARLDEAVPVLHRAAEAAVRGKNDAAAVLAWLTLGKIAGDDLEHPDEGLRWTGLGEAMIARLGSPPDLELKRLLTDGAIYDTNHRSEELGEMARRALALAQSMRPPNPIQLARAFDGMSAALAEEGHADESLADEQRAVQLLEANGAGEGAMAANFLGNAAITAANAHRYADAERFARRALALFDRLDPDAPGALGALVFLGEALINLHRLDEAQAVLERAQPLAERHARDVARARSQVIWHLGEIELERGHAAVAVAAIERALGDAGMDATDRPYMQFDLARALWAKGDKARARALARSVEQALAGDALNRPGVVAWEAAHR